MPASRPSASFVPISPDFNLPALVEATPNFEYVVRIPFEMIEQQGLENFEKLVLLHVILGGKPLVIEGYDKCLDPWTFSLGWLKANKGKKHELARNLIRQENIPLTFGHYLDSMPKLTKQFNAHNYRDLRYQRIYLKDIDCPELWHDKLKEIIPENVFYLNESTGRRDGPGAIDEPALTGRSMIRGKGIAPAGDLMSSLPPKMRAENMMCYIGHEGTYTPAHREMCASLGQNIMVAASTNVNPYTGEVEKPGSSIWFMTETKDRHMVSEYWLSVLGHDIEVESHFAQIVAWQKAPFKTYIVEQKVGDFILVPPLAPHQVWNRGTRTMKAAWNRTTVETLEMAIEEALPRARMVCRDEQYKNKAIIYFTLEKYSKLLNRAEEQEANTWDPNDKLALRGSKKIRQMKKDFRRLFALYTKILLSEMLSPHLPQEKNIEYVPFESNVACSYCRCNIFNRFLTCKHCINLLEDGDEDAYDVCMDCYAMGRSCECISGLQWVEQFKWKELVEKYENWRHLVLNFTGRIDAGSPQPLEEERKRMTKKTLAQVCQEQLKMRPFRDPSKPHDPLSVSDDEEEQVRVLADGTAKKRKKKRSEKWMREHKNCHICKHREPTWKLVTCQCGNYYCYGSLFRAFDMMPFEIMENPEWKCPKCLKICSCGACRKDPEQRPFDPNGTLLGHDTKKVADPRSVESLVDFSRSNLKWLNDDMREHARRLKRRREQAERDKATDPTLNDEQYADDDDYEAMDAMDGIVYTEVDDMPIDPLLSMDTSVSSQPPNKPAVQPAPELVQNQSSFMSEEPRDNSSGMPIATMLSDDTPPVQYPNPSLEHESSSTVIPGDGRSQLERNPELFIQRAKLAGFYGENQEMQDGGIHPSNDESVLDPSLRSITEPSHSTTIGTFPTEQRTSPKRKQPGDRVAEGGSPSKKRRSKVANNEGPKNVTELGEPAKTAPKDKPKDSAFNGRPDEAVLPAGDPPKQQHSFGMDGAADDDEFIIIKSNIVSARPKAVTNTEQAHRTKVRVERDEEFVLRKKDRHKIQKVNAKKISNGNTWIEISDDSGDGSDIAKGGTDKNYQPRKRARLSARLSRKQQHNTEMSSEATLHDSTSEPLAGPILQDSESRLPDGTPKRIQTAAVENRSTVEIDDNVVDNNIIWTQDDQHPLSKERNSTQSRTVSVASSHDTPPQGMAEKIKKDIDSGAKEIREDTTSQINGTLTGIKMTVETHHRPTRVNPADTQKVRYKGDRVGISKENLVPTKTPRQSSQANANFEAKMRALRWAEGVSSDIDTPSDTDTSSGEAHDQPVPPQLETKKPKPTIIEQRKPRGRPPKHGPKSKSATVSNNATPVLGPSRFSKLATGKKVRIVSAKSTKKATTDVGTRFTPINAGVLE